MELLDAAGGKPVIMTRVTRAYRQLATALTSQAILLPATDLDQLVVDAQNASRLPPAGIALRAAAASPRSEYPHSNPLT